ncbi:MAG: ATP-binding protein [Pseudomonadota bacterium]
MTDDCRLSCAATLGNVRLLADAVRGWVEANGLGEAFAADFELAVVEAANNVVLHGTQGLQGQTMSVSICHVPGGVEVTLEDRGRAIPPDVLEAAIPPDLGVESGRGMGLIAACTDRVDYSATAEGNRLVLFKAVPPDVAEPAVGHKAAP